jgi:hypothetical protein
MRAGKLNSISIVPNTSAFEQCMAMLYEQIPSLPFLPLMSVHLDFVEGRSLAGREAAPLLTRDGSDLMGLSWGDLFKLSYLPWKRGEAKKHRGRWNDVWSLQRQRESPVRRKGCGSIPISMPI